MKKFKYLLSVLCVLCLFGCDLFDNDESKSDDIQVLTPPNVTVWGNIYDAATGLDVSNLTAADVTVTVIYGSTRKQCSVVITPASSTTLASVVFYTDIPEDTDAKFEAKVTGYNDFWAHYYANMFNPASSLQTAEPNYTFTERHTVQKDIPLFKTLTTTDNDRVYKLRGYVKNASVNDPLELLSSATGTYSLVLTGFTAVNFRGKDFGTTPQPYIGMASSGAIASGTFTIPGSALLPGATYKLTVTGVDGYQTFVDTAVSGLTATPDGSGYIQPVTDAVSYVDLATIMTDPAVAVIAQSWMDTSGSIKQGLTTITITLNQDVELHPAITSNYVPFVGLNATLASDRNNSGTFPEWITADAATVLTDPSTYDLATTYTTTSTSTISVTSNVITITASTANITSEKDSDDYSLTYFLDRIYVRAAGTEDNYTQIFAGGASITSVQNEVY